MVPARCDVTARAFLFSAPQRTFLLFWSVFSTFGGMCTFREDFTRKSKNACFGVAPRLTAQPGFSAGFLKELLAREAIFDGHLRQEEPAVRMEDDEQPVSSNLDRFRRDRFQRRKQGDFHAQMFELLFFRGSESRIFQCGAAGAANDGFSQRFAGLGHPNATLQTPARVKSNEYSAPLREDSIARYHVGKFPPGNGLYHGIAR